MKKYLKQLLTAIAFKSGIFAVNSACSSFYHQPHPPKAMNDYRK